MPFKARSTARRVLGALCIITALVSSHRCKAQMTANVLRRMLLIQVPGSTGTAFTIEVDNRQYIITAKHVAAKLKSDEDTIQIRKKSGWSPLRVKIFRCDDPVDIVVLVPPSQVTVDFPLEPSSVGLAVGQDAYFVGFPYRAFMQYRSLPDLFALVKRATVAAFESFPDQRAQAIHLDGYNNPGFSGAPVVYRDFKQSGIVYKVAGVLVKFVYDASPVVKKKEELKPEQVRPEDLAEGRVVRMMDGRFFKVEETDELVSLNTGIATAWDIGSAVDLIRNKHMSGPKVDDNFTGADQELAAPQLHH